MNLRAVIKSAKIKSDLIKIKDDFISIFSSPFKWNVDEINYFLSFLAILTICLYLDEYVTGLFSIMDNKIADEVFTLAKLYGKPRLTIFSIIILYIPGFILAKDNIRTIGLKIFESFAFSGIIITILKPIWERWKIYPEYRMWSFIPFHVGLNDHPSSPSYDTVFAFALSVILAGIFNNKLWKIFWYFIAFITSIGRIYQNQYQLSNVIAASAVSIYIGIHITNIHKLKTIQQ